MKTRPLRLLALFLATTLACFAAELTGTWVTEFDSQIGKQKYTFVFKTEENQIAGQASFEREFGNGSVDLQGIKVDGDKVTFIEKMDMQGMEIVITYRGTLTADEMTLTRQVGEFATEHIVAHRQAAD